MNNKSVWAVLGVIVLVVGGVVCVTQLSAQREPPRPEIIPFQPPQVGRFVVARVDGSKIILLDTVTGDLYKASEDDFKRYSNRPRIAPGWPQPFVGKDGPRDRPFRDRFEKDAKEKSRDGFKRDGDKRDSKKDGDFEKKRPRDGFKRDGDKDRKIDFDKDRKREFPKDQKFEKKDK